MTTPTGKGTTPVASGQPVAVSATTATQPGGSTTTGPKATPKDAAVIAQILREMGVNEYEPRVVHQLLEFSYRYVSTVLEDAVVYSTYAGKKSVDTNDIELAVSKLSDKMFTTPPPKEVLIEMARSKNSIPLPAIKSHAGPRLPPEKHSLISANYKCRPGVKVNGTETSGLLTGPFRSNSGTLLMNQRIISLQSRNPNVGGTPGTTRIIIGSNVTTSAAGDSSGVKRKLDG